jgi:hypothetical protein
MVIKTSRVLSIQVNLQPQSYEHMISLPLASYDFLACDKEE